MTTATAFTALAAHGAAHPGPLTGAAPSSPMERALVRAHAGAGRLFCGPETHLTVATVRALMRRRLVEPIHEGGRTDLRKVIIGMDLNIAGSREAQRIIREGIR